MGILAVNLDHYIQRFELWVYYVVMSGLLLAYLIADINVPDSWLFFYYAVVALVSGHSVASIQREAISKPFTFCLPGHRTVPRKIIFMIGSAVSILMSLLLIIKLSVTFYHGLLLTVSSSFLAMALFLFGAMSALGKPATSKIFNSLLFIILLVSILELSNSVGNVLMLNPAIVIVLSSFACLTFWTKLGKAAVVRENCGKLVIGMMDGWNIEKKRRYKEQMLKAEYGRQGTGVLGGLEGFFLGKMRKYGSNSLGRYVWGHLYAVMSKNIGVIRWRWVLLCLLFFILLGYLNVFVGIVSAIPALYALFVNLNAHSSMLLPDGRREQYWGTIISGIAITAAVVVVFSVLVCFSNWLAMFMPTIMFKGHEFEYHMMSFFALPIDLVFMPLVLAVGVMFPRSELAKPAVIFFVVLPICGVEDPIVIGVLIAGAWLLYMWMIDRHFRRGQLV